MINEAEMTVRWQPVELGIREGNRVQLLDSSLRGRVVTLGQQMVDDGSAITIPDQVSKTSPDAKSNEAMKP